MKVEFKFQAKVLLLFVLLVSCKTTSESSESSAQTSDSSELGTSGENKSGFGMPPTVLSGVVVFPGDGFVSGTTEEPPAVGNPEKKAADQRAIARWSAVPFQTLSSDAHLGIVADHYTGINRVEFSVDGGEWKAVNSPAVNPQTNVKEYFVTLKIADFSDGLHEIRAIVYPNHGLPRVLAGPVMNALPTGNHSLFVSTNRDQTLSSPIVWVAPEGNDTTGDGSESKPYKTLSRAGFALAGGIPDGNAGGGTMYLKPGNYNLGSYLYAQRFNALDRWLTIQAAPGVDRSLVKIVSATLSGLRTDLVRFYNLTISPNPGSPYVIQNVSNRGLVWIDHCSMTSQNFDDTSSSLWYMGWKSGGQFITETTIVNVRGTPLAGALVRNTTIEHVADDAVKNAYAVFNLIVKDLNPQGTDHHPDVWQCWNPNGVFQNFMVQNLVATDTVEAQGLFFHGWTNLFLDGSFRDVVIDNSNNGAGSVFVNLHIHRPLQHVLFKNSVLIGGGLYRTGGDPSTPQVSHNIFSGTDMLMEDMWADYAKTEFIVPFPDGDSSYQSGVWPGTLPWLSPLGVTYQLSTSPLPD